jgi:hypothetical protein
MKLVNGILELDKTDADFFVYLNPKKQDEYNSVKMVIDNFEKIDTYNNSFLLFRAIGSDRVMINGLKVSINHNYFSN